MIHIFTTDDRKRTRRLCPYHKHLCYGELTEYYDTTHVVFDCGTFVDYGYGQWNPPPKKKCPNCRKHFRPIEMIEHQKEHKPIRERQGYKE